MNYTDAETPYTRILEHKHFEFGTQPVTYVTKEYPADWEPGQEATIPSMMHPIRPSMQSMPLLPKKNSTSSLAAVWQSTSITIWMTPSKVP